MDTHKLVALVNCVDAFALAPQVAPPATFPVACNGELGVGDMIITPIDAIPVEKGTNTLWATFRGAHKIPKKNNQSTNGNTSGLIHRRSNTDVAAAPA